MKRLIGVLMAAGLLLLGGSVSLFAGSSTYTFDGNPPAPTSAYNTLDGFDVVIDGAENGDQSMDTVQAQHGADCGAPPATHPVSSFDNAVFQCRDHFMTVVEGGADKYTIISLTPPALLDFSTGEACASFDVSTFRGSDRDWWEVWLTPFADNLAEPHQDWLPAAQGEPRNAMMVRLEGSQWVQAHVVRDFNATEVAATGYRQFFTPSATVRTPHELCVTKTSLVFKVGGQVALSASFAAVPFDRGVFQIQHSAYNPEKGACVDGCGANTWHWDNVSLNPSIPFTIIHGNVRTFGQYQGGTVTFDSPAPAGAFLRFSGLGNWDWLDGSTWRPVQRQATEMNRPEHAQSYWTPIPAGTTSVTLRGRGQDWNGSFVARDFSIWSMSTSGSTPVSTATPTVPAATNTPTDTPVATNTPTATPTVAPATVTPTATPATYRCQRRNPNGTWSTVWSKPGGGSCP